MPFLSVITNYSIHTGGILAFFVAPLQKQFDKVCIMFYVFVTIQSQVNIVKYSSNAGIRKNIL